MKELITANLDIWSAAVTAKTTGAGRSSGNKGAYGINKLRELILELAVRGKLVPQDPNDEPASELLKQIRKEKDRRIANGKIRKDQSLPSITNEEKPFELPDGWSWIRFGTICVIERGGSPRPIKSYITNDRDGLSWIKIGDTDQGGKYITATSAKIRKEGLSKTRMVYPGDFLLTNSMSFGRPYITKIEGCIHDGWLRISPPEQLDKDFLYLLLSSPYLRNMFIAAAAGAVVQNLNADKVRELPIFIPPLTEQHRIVAKVDELMALCDQLEAEQANAADAHEKLVSILLDALTQGDSFRETWANLQEHFDVLFTTPASIDKLKKTLLQLAVMGKLVPQDPNDEPASELLEKIRTEKDRLIAEGKVKKGKSLPPIEDEKRPFQLPIGWEWSKLGAVTTGMDSGWSPSCLDNCSPSDKVWGVLKTTSVQVMEYLERENKELPRNLVPRPDAEVKSGDILFTRAGPKNRVGISCLVETTRPRLMISDKIIRFHPVETGIYGRFIALCLNVGVTAEFLEKTKSGMAASQVNITQDNLRSAPVPIAPLAEQHRIVAKIDELAALCAQLKTHMIEAGEQQRKLADAMVEGW